MRHLLTSKNKLITGCSLDHISREISQFMNEKSTCLCCSNTLLRHVCSGGLYWRCSYCYQEMPSEKMTRGKSRMSQYSDWTLTSDSKFVILP